jgi:hypothetical protein
MMTSQQAVEVIYAYSLNQGIAISRADADNIARLLFSAPAQLCNVRPRFEYDPSRVDEEGREWIEKDEA